MSRWFETSRNISALLLTLSLASCASATYDTHDDMTVSTEVKIALIGDRELGSFRIDTRTDHGVVTLSGTVDNQREVDRAVSVAKKVKGVRSVKSDLKLAAGG
jgi:osmotically-inducible protein OsmY